LSAGKFVTVVSGLPRTGTSMMMRMLEAGGMEALSDNIRQADVDNPNGYYEFERVKKIKEDASWLSDTVGKVFKMVSMLLFELPASFQYKVIFMERDIDEMMASQDKMLARLGKASTDSDPEKMKALYSKHLSDIKAWLDAQPNIDIIYVKYNDFITDPRSMASVVAAFLGGGLDEEKMAAVVDKKLYRNRAGI
jgi:hypothetical protein